MDPRLVSGAEVFNPERWCYLGICDWFPSATEKLARIAVVSSVIVAAGVIGGRAVKSNNKLLGMATSTVTVVLTVGLVWYLYPWAAGANT
jgi:hypothetical protein